MGLRLLAVACLVGAAFAGPFQRESRCATHCPKPFNEKFNYEPGKKYVYDYTGINHIIVAGHRKQKASVSGTAEIHVRTKCELVLKLKDIRIEQKERPEDTDELIRKLEIPLPFAYEDGKIDHVCPSRDEDTQSQNIKKGILSTIINTMTKLDTSEERKEVDSLGTCVTRYTMDLVHEHVIEKEKDLKSCTNRHSSVTSLITNPYDAPESNIHTLPIFPQEKLLCRQWIEEGIIKNVKCNEQATIKPFKKQDSIIEFEGEIELNLRNVEIADNLPIEDIDKHHPILYNLDEEKSEEDREEEAKHILRKMCSKNQDFMDITISKDYIDLVSAVSSLSSSSLEKIYKSLESGRLCSRKKVMDVFLDSLPMAGNEGSVKLMVKLLVEKKVTGLKAKLWSASFALVPKPSREALAAVVPLVKANRTSAVLLGVSAMVHRYCTQMDCSREPAVKSIISELRKDMGRHCSSDKEKEVIAVLKAFGNMGHIGEAEEDIMACMMDTDKSIPLRLAAIDAFRRTNERRPEQILDLYLDDQQHFELRIAAVSSVMRKADRQQISKIMRVQESEKDEQVSSYVHTLISNWKKTSSPQKKEVKTLLQEVSIKAPKSRYLTNSKNVELSSFSETFNVGGGMELDVIHAPETKIPRSIYKRFDLYMFDKHVNLYEIGIRAEGLEEAMKKLIGFKDNQKSRSSWSFLRSSNILDRPTTQASMFVRTMNTEIFDLSVNDFSGMGQMMKIADVLNKISHDKKADLSHSFLFMNSKLVIPSVTGRSYSFGLTGSATMGMTASSKVDIVNLMASPSNCDVHGRFQPSVNVEVAATVGIQSSKPRPDIKIVTRLHSRSDIEARFHIKDGHLGLASVSMPSEDIVLAKISSEVVEIAADHSETPIIKVKENKFDYCFDKLQKPLGVSVCGKWEVPRPLLTKTLPFVRGVGNVELSIKKSDLAMKGYEFSFEIPRHKSQVMKYKVSMDTPGSRVNRLFKAELEVKKASSGRRDLSMELRSPFKNATATGSYTLRSDLMEGSLEFISSLSRKYSFTATSPITESSTQKVFKPTVEISLPSSQPVTVAGTISVTKGRKQQIAIDIKSNKPARRPLAVKGTLIKEGVFGLSKSAEWKLSTDLAMRTPLINAQIRGLTEKQAKQSHTVSTTLKVDYQRGRSQKHSLQLSGTLQKSSGKISSSAQFEMTQFPQMRCSLSWNMQGKLRESLKNDITLKYGRDMERNYINILHSSQMPENAPGECKISVKAPHMKIDSDLVVLHEVKRNSKVHLEVDLRYKAEKHVKGLLHWDKISSHPLKMNIKTELELPNRKLMYHDEIQETGPHTFEGNSLIQWREGRPAELKYKYQKLSDNSKFHHELETTLRLPNSRSPIKNKVSIALSHEFVGIEGRANIERSDYLLKAHLNRRGVSHMTMKLPKVEGTFKIINEPRKKAVDMDLKTSFSRRSRHITAVFGLNTGDKKKVEMEIHWDVDNNPSKKIVASTLLEISGSRSRGGYTCVSKLQITDIVNLDTAISGDLSLLGRHEASIETAILRWQPMSLTIHHEMNEKQVKFTARVAKNNADKAELTLEAMFDKKPREIEISTNAALKSLDNSFESKEWRCHHIISRSSSSMTVKSNTLFKWSPSKIYESELSFDYQPNLLLFKAFLNTPHIKFEKQAVGFSFRRSDRIIAQSATIEFSNDKVISISSETQTSVDAISSDLKISSPFEIVRDAKVHVSVEKQRSKKSFEASVEVNGEKKMDSEVTMVSSPRSIEIEGRIKTIKTPEISGRVIIEKSRDSFKYWLQVRKESNALLSKHSTWNEDVHSMQTKSNEKTMIDLKITKELSREGTKYNFEARGPFSPMYVSVLSSRREQNSLNLDISACHEKTTRTCFVMKTYHKSMMNSENFRFYKKVTVDLEKSIESESEHWGSVNLVLAVGDNDFRQKILVEAKRKTLGYEIKLHHKQNENDHCSLESNIYMQHRTISMKSSAHHNRESLHLDFEVIPDTSVPSRKLEFETKMELSRNNKEVSGFMKMAYPDIKKPIQLECKIQREGLLPVGGKFELDYSPVSGKAWTVEILPENERSGKQTLMYKIYRENKSVDIAVKVIRHSSRQEDKYGYEWSWKSATGLKTGEASVKLSDKRNGIPQAFEIASRTPSVDVRVKGSLVWLSRIPSDVSITVLKNGENVYELMVKGEQYCIIAEETLRSEPFVKSHFCLSKIEDNVWKLIDIESYCREHKCLDINLQIDPHQFHIAKVVVNWEKEDIRRSMEEMVSLVPYLSETNFSELKRQIKEKIESIWAKFSPIFKDLKHKIEDWKESHSFELRKGLQHLRDHELWSSLPWDVVSSTWYYMKDEFMVPLWETVKCVARKYYEFINVHIPDLIRGTWEIMRKEILTCLKEYCPADSFCRKMIDTYERHGLKEAHRMARRKWVEMKSTITESVWKMKWIPDITERFREVWRMAARFNDYMFSKIDRMQKSLERWARDKFSSIISRIKDIIRSIISRYEDRDEFRALQTYVEQTKIKAIHAWENKETLLKEMWHPLREALMEEYPRNWLKEKFSVQKFSPREGKIEIEIHHPLQRKHLMILKNAIVAVKNKVMGEE